MEMQPLVALVAQELYLGLPFVIGVPFAFFLEEGITRCTPGVWPSMVIISFLRKPLLAWIRNQVLTYESLEATPVRGALYRLWFGSG